MASRVFGGAFALLGIACGDGGNSTGATHSTGTDEAAHGEVVLHDLTVTHQ